MFSSRSSEESWIWGRGPYLDGRCKGCLHMRGRAWTTCAVLIPPCSSVGWLQPQVPQATIATSRPTDNNDLCHNITVVRVWPLKTALLLNRILAMLFSMIGLVSTVIDWKDNENFPICPTLDQSCHNVCPMESSESGVTNAKMEIYNPSSFLTILCIEIQLIPSYVAIFLMELVGSHWGPSLTFWMVFGVCFVVGSPLQGHDSP